MKEFLKDLFRCFKLSLGIFLIPLILAVIISVMKGLFNGNLTMQSVITAIKYGGMWLSCFGLFISAIAFVKVEMLSPLNYEEQWKTYFSKMNLVVVILFISLFMLSYSIIIDIFLYKMY